MPRWGNGRPPVYKREMKFESLKSTEVDEYGTIAGSSPALGSKLTQKNIIFRSFYIFIIKQLK